MRDMTVAVYAGSFDPFTNGHLSMVKQAAKIFDRLIIVIAENSKKKRQYDLQAMQDAILECLIQEKLTNCTVVTSSRMTVDVCSEYRADYLVRGIRSTSDFLYEEDIAKINKKLNPNIKTVYLRAEDDALSSSMVRELLVFDKDISTYVPSSVFNLVDKERAIYVC